MQGEHAHPRSKAAVSPNGPSCCHTNVDIQENNYGLRLELLKISPISMEERSDGNGVIWILVMYRLAADVCWGILKWWTEQVELQWMKKGKCEMNNERRSWFRIWLEHRGEREVTKET